MVAIVFDIEFGGERGLVDRGGDRGHGLRLRFHREADAVGRFLHFGDGRLDRRIGVDGRSRGGLDRGDLGGDVVGRARGLVGEALHFLRDHREAAAGVAGARRLDRGVEREQIGLAGNVADQAQDRFDRLGVIATSASDMPTACAGLRARAVGDLGGGFDFGAGILDRADQAGGGLRGFAHRDRRLLGGGGDFGGLADHPARGGRGAHRLVAQRVAFLARAFDHRGDAVAEFGGERLARGLRGVLDDSRYRARR